MRELYQSYDGLGLAELVRKGEVSALELLDTAIELAEEQNERLNAITVWDIDRARRKAANPVDGPFMGVPFLLKDLFAPMDGLASTDGTRLYDAVKPIYDAEVVSRFKASGVVVFGRAASPEFGLTTTTESARHGATRNPWNTEFSTGGSSGGSAAMVASRVVPLAHASDGGGSIRVPASNCGIFGLKPSRARVSSAPDFGEGWSGLSTAGVVSRTVRDSAAMLDVIAGSVPGDPYVIGRPGRSFLKEVDETPGRLRVAMVSDPFNDVPVDPTCMAALQGAAIHLDSLGHEVDELLIELDDEITELARPLVEVHTLRMLEDFGEMRGMPVSQDEVEVLTWELAERGRGITATEFVRVVDRIHAVGRTVAAAMEGFDVVMSPMMAIPPPRLGELSPDRIDEASTLTLKQTLAFGQVMNVTGMPAMSVPMHWSFDGLPIGVQFAAAQGREDLLFRLAGQLERSKPWHDRHP